MRHTGQGPRSSARDSCPKVSMDYFFMSQADEKADKNPLIVMVDESTGEKYARAVGKQGIGEENEMEWLVKDMSEEMKSWGHQGGDGGHIILKSDGERSIVASRTAFAKFHRGEGSCPRTRRAERASRTGQSRRPARLSESREHVQDKAEVEPGAPDVIVLWMVRWAAMMVSRFLVGKDGLTTYERRRGRKCRIPVVAFGEKVWYKEIRRGKERANKLESEWREGLWLGHSRRSNEAIIGTREGVVRAYAVKRMDEESRWGRQVPPGDEGDPAAARPVTPRVGHPDQSEHRPAARGVTSTSRRASR